VDAKKKAILAEDAPTAMAMHGANHMDQDVSKMMEVAGTKAARKNTVMLNEQHFEYVLSLRGVAEVLLAVSFLISCGSRKETSLATEEQSHYFKPFTPFLHSTVLVCRKSFGGNMGGVHQELFSVKLKPGYDTTIPMNETSKKAWLTAIFSIRPSFSGGAPVEGSVKKSSKSAKQIVVSQKVSQKSGTGTLETPSANHSSKPRRNSKDNDVMDFSDEEKPRRNSKEQGHPGIAEGERGVKSSAKSAAFDSSRRRGSQEPIPSGRIKNPALTKDAVGRIDQVSPIEAWQNQSVASAAASSSSGGSSGGAGVSSKSAKKPSAAVTAGIAAVTSSMKYQIGTADRGGGVGGGDASAGIAAGRSAKKKHYTTVEAFDMSGFSDEEKEVSGSSKPPARRNSLSKHPNATTHNSTWAETTIGTSASAAIGIGGSFSSKRR
jgi:hypothetical protein